MNGEPDKSSRRGFFTQLAGIAISPLAVKLGEIEELTPSPPEPIKLLPPPDEGPFDPDYLDRWLRAPREPLGESRNPKANRLLKAVRTETALTVYYYGGSQPGTRRRITPKNVFTVQGYWGVYCEAWCHARETLRTFNLDKIAFQPRDFA